MGFLRDVLLTINATVLLPMYSMLIWCIIYFALLYYGPLWLRYALLIYTPFCIFDQRPKHGTKLPLKWVAWLRRLRIFQLAREYYPVELHKTVDLDGKAPYAFLYHPHGVISMGLNVALVTDACDFDKLFPNIRNRWGVTLNVCFYVPIFREWMIMNGLISADKQSLTRKLKAGDSVILVPGGAAEAFHANRGNFKLYINKRRGYINVCLETGAVPVPVIGFGENKILHTYYPSDDDDSFNIFYEIQRKLSKLLSFSLPILTWPLPVRQPIHVVVGAPVVFTSRDVDECRKQYVQAVKELYEKQKDKYGHGNIPLNLL